MAYQDWTRGVLISPDILQNILKICKTRYYGIGPANFDKPDPTLICIPVLPVHAELESKLAQPGEGVQEVGSAVPVVHILANLSIQYLLSSKSCLN